MNWTGTALPDSGAQQFAVVRPASEPTPEPSSGSETRLASGSALTDHHLDHALAERRLVARVFGRCNSAILAASKSSSVPPEFLGALTANESAGNAGAARFEPAVYRHLAAVVSGDSPAYGSIGAKVAF